MYKFDQKMELLNIEDVSKLLKVSTSTVRRLQQARKLPFIKVGGGIRFTMHDISEYLNKARIEALE